MQSRRWGGGAGAGESAGAAKVFHHGPPLCLQAAYPCPWLVTDICSLSLFGGETYAISFAIYLLKDFSFPVGIQLIFSWFISVNLMLLSVIITVLFYLYKCSWVGLFNRVR